MSAGKKVLEALIVYSKIEVKRDGSDLKKYTEDGQQVKSPSYTDFNADAIQKELTQNTKLIKMTMGEEGNSSASDSEPSADNLDEDEMAKIAPIKPADTVTNMFIYFIFIKMFIEILYMQINVQIKMDILFLTIIYLIFIKIKNKIQLLQLINF